MNKQPLRFWRGPGGALMCDQEIPGVTQKLTGDTAEWYTGTWFLGETILTATGKSIAEALGGIYTEDKPEDIP